MTTKDKATGRKLCLLELALRGHLRSQVPQGRRLPGQGS